MTIFTYESKPRAVEKTFIVVDGFFDYGGINEKLMSRL
jgi:hypothetical protein